MPERLAVFVAYQNMHLTAHNLFAPYGVFDMTRCEPRRDTIFGLT